MDATGIFEAAVGGPGQIARLMEDVREICLGDERPWVVGYSGGKDSTTALQLVWTALSALPPDERTKPVYVISSDTRLALSSISRSRPLGPVPPRPQPGREVSQGPSGMGRSP